MSKLPLFILCALTGMGGISFAEPQVDEDQVVSPLTEEQDIQAANRAEEAIPMDRLGAGAILDIKGSFTNQYQAVVKVENSFLTPNYAMPWQAGKYGTGRGTAFLVGDNLFMTNAHVVSNVRQLYISKYGDSRKIPARVVHIAHDCDLALLKVEDFSSFEGITPLEIGVLPRLEDEVRALGYPIGGERLSVTRGVVSRIDRINYSHTMADAHLVVQIDAAINPGNSGGPLLLGHKAVGVAFQGLSQADNTGYVIPSPVIEHFLEDVKDGKYDGYVGLGVVEFPILNSAMRTKLGLPDDEKGVLIAEIYASGPAAGILKPGDVILTLDGKEVDSSGKLEVDGETVNMNEAVERKFAGDMLKVVYVRDKEKKEVELKLAPVRSRAILGAVYDKRPRYVVFGGLVFQPGERNTILAHKLSNPRQNIDLEEFVLRGGNEDQKDYVLLTESLRDEVNEQQPASLGSVVKKVNGTSVKSLRHFYELLHPETPPEFFIIELEGSSRPLVFEAKSMEAANARISRQYGIQRDNQLN